MKLPTSKACLLFILAVPILAGAPGHAREPLPYAPVTVMFEPGQSTANVSGTLKPGEQIRYELDVTRGQRMIVRLKETAGTGSIRVGLDGDKTAYPGADAVKEWEGEVPLSGTQVVAVTAGSERLSFTVHFEVKPFSPGPVTYHLPGASNKYDFDVELRNRQPCRNPLTVMGAARVGLRRKGDKAPLQVLEMRHLFLEEVEAPRAKGARRRIAPAEYMVEVEEGDYNMDGFPDLAICNGHNGGYGASSFDIFLWDNRLHRFVGNKAFSDLTSHHDGMFEVDAKRKRLVAIAKSGCCWHIEHTYRVVANRPKLVEETVDDALQDRYEVITTRKLVGGKWMKRIRRVPK